MEVNKVETPEDEREISLNETSLKRSLEAIDVIGGHGPWQFRQWIVYFAATLCNATIAFSALFLPSQRYCFSEISKGVRVHKASILEINNTANLPLMRSYVKNESIFWDNSCNSTDCKTNMSASDVSSAKPLYEVECWNSQVETFIKCSYMIAFAVSAVLVYFSSWRLGRRPLALVSCLFLVASSLGTSWADTPAVFLILRFVVSIGTFNIYLISAFSLMEYIHKDFKLLYFFTGHLGWGMAHFLLPAVAWLAEDWISFNIALSGTGIILSILVWWGLVSPTSPGSELTRARKTLKYAAFINGYSTTEVDMLSHNFAVRPESKRDLGSLLSTPKMKIQCLMYFTFLFAISFTTSFLYFAVKWNPNWFKVDGNRIKFSFLGTTEVAATIILLFLTCIVAVKHLWACVSMVAATLMIIIFSRTKEGTSTSSALLFTVTVFFTSASWTLLLAKSFCHKMSDVIKKFNLLSTGVAVFAGSLTASAVILKADNQDALLVFAIAHFIFAIVTAFLPDDYFGTVS